MYSEHNEQKIIQDFFKNRDKGLLLDVGANQGVSGSNSLYLLEKGWHGILLEPNKQKCKELITNYKQKNLLEQTTIINNALVPNFFNQNAKFYDTKKGNEIGHGVGSFNKSWVEQWVIHLNKRENTQEYSLIENIIQPYRVNEFFQTYGYNYNFISIDVELLNLELATSIEWHKMNDLELICIEADDNTEMSTSRFQCVFDQFGYQLMQTDSSGLNLFFCRNKY